MRKNTQNLVSAKAGLLAPERALAFWGALPFFVVLCGRPTEATRVALQKKQRGQKLKASAGLATKKIINQEIR